MVQRRLQNFVKKGSGMQTVKQHEVFCENSHLGLSRSAEKSIVLSWAVLKWSVQSDMEMYLFLLSKEVIPVDQDPLGKQASPVKNGDMETWVKPLANGSVAVGVVNLGGSATQATVNASDLHLPGAVKSARDLWKHQDVQFTDGKYTAEVPSHGVLMLRVSAP
jgi:hypothetical protein